MFFQNLQPVIIDFMIVDFKSKFFEDLTTSNSIFFRDSVSCSFCYIIVEFLGIPFEGPSGL